MNEEGNQNPRTELTAIQEFERHYEKVEFGSPKHLALSDRVTLGEKVDLASRIAKENKDLEPMTLSALQTANSSVAAIQETIRIRTDTLPGYYDEKIAVTNLRVALKKEGVEDEKIAVMFNSKLKQTRESGR